MLKKSISVRSLRRGVQFIRSFMAVKMALYRVDSADKIHSDYEWIDTGGCPLYNPCLLELFPPLIVWM